MGRRGPKALACFDGPSQCSRRLSAAIWYGFAGAKLFSRGMLMDTSIESGKRIFRILLLLCAAFTLLSCDETPSSVEKRITPKPEKVGFEAAITGAYEGEVSGNGVLVLLSEAGFEKQGYFFLSDGQGIRPHGVTFVLPRGLVVGKHTLESPSPLDIGTVPSVRVDRDVGSGVVSAAKNTSGFLEITSFPEDEGRLTGSDVAGHFEFQSENSKGETVRVTGTFSFKVR